MSSFVLGLCGCQSILSVSHSDMTVKKGAQIFVRDSDFGILHLFTPDISVSGKLASKCPGGLVTGVEATARLRDFIIFQIYSLEAKASCQDSVAIAK